MMAAVHASLLEGGGRFSVLRPPNKTCRESMTKFVSCVCASDFSIFLCRVTIKNFLDLRPFRACRATANQPLAPAAFRRVSIDVVGCCCWLLVDGSVCACFLLLPLPLLQQMRRPIITIAPPRTATAVALHHHDPPSPPRWIGTYRCLNTNEHVLMEAPVLYRGF
jgi:hypothetical protein